MRRQVSFSSLCLPSNAVSDLDLLYLYFLREEPVGGPRRGRFLLFCNDFDDVPRTYEALQRRVSVQGSVFIPELYYHHVSNACDRVFHK